MAHDALTLYKLMILFMLDQLEFPLTTSQFLEFFVSKKYAPYFHLQQSIHELDDAHFIRGEARYNSTSYQITEEGKEALSLFQHKIPPAIRADILDYFNENSYKLREEAAITTDYRLLENGEYLVKVQILEKQNLLLEIDLNVISESQARNVCDKWQEKSSEVYDYLIRNLLLDNKS